jgi:hypothetical protein
MPRAVEAGLHHGDHLDRASQIHGLAQQQEAAPTARGLYLLGMKFPPTSDTTANHDLGWIDQCAYVWSFGCQLQ